MGKNIKYLIKFVSQEKHANDFIDGKLYTHIVAYYQELERVNGKGQGDIVDGNISHEFYIARHTNLPIFCMTAVCEDDIQDDGFVVPEHILEAFDCENGFAVVVPYYDFVDTVKRSTSISNKCIYGQVNYGIISQDLFKTFITAKPTDYFYYQNLFIKHPCFSYQNEFRLVILDAQKIEPHKELEKGYEVFVFSLTDYKAISYDILPLGSKAKKYAINALRDGDKYIIKF